MEDKNLQEEDMEADRRRWSIWGVNDKGKRSEGVNIVEACDTTLCPWQGVLGLDTL